MNIYEIFNESKNLSEVLKKMNLSDNVINWKKIKEMAIDVNFDINVYKERKKRYCLKCGTQLKKGQKKFCCHSCSATFNNTGRVITDETKEKIKSGVIKFINDSYGDKIPKNNNKNSIKTTIKKEKKICVFCGNEIEKYGNKYCSNDCHSKYRHKLSYEYFLNNPNKFNRGNYTPNNFKDFFMIEQNNKCIICGCDNYWNGNKLVFVIDHIDGDASNNKRENLRMVCPNCDSQLETFKSKNKNSSRRNYWKEKIIRENKEAGSMQGA